MKTFETIKKFSILPQGIRYKLLIAFSLMSIIPLLVIGYIVNSYVLLEEPASLSQVSLIVLFCVIIAWLGLFLAKTIIERVIDIAIDTKIITNGNFDKKINVDTGDEVGQIGEAINYLTRRIKDNILDLKDYQGKMKEINVEIQKKVSVLSNLLQIGELISSSVKVDSILDLALGKISGLCEGGFAALYFTESENKELTLRASQDLNNEKLLKATINEGSGLLGKALLKRKHAILDSSSRLSGDEQAFKSEYKCDNVVVMPINLGKSAKAVLLAGNSIKDFAYTNEDIDSIRVFAEQIAIAIENDILITRADKLEIKDSMTGLFNKQYILTRLKEEIGRSVVSQRPCSFAIINVDDFKGYESRKGKPQGEVALRKIGSLITDLSGPLSKIGRMEGDAFGVIMPEVNKKGSLEAVEKIRKNIEKLDLSSEKGDRLTVSCGVSENPIDGSTFDDILDKANKALIGAKSNGKNKVMGAGV